MRGSSSSPTNSEKEGTVLSLSLKYVGRLFVMGSGGEASVAKLLEDAEADMKERVTCRSGGAFKHRNLDTAVAILPYLKLQCRC